MSRDSRLDQCYKTKTSIGIRVTAVIEAYNKDNRVLERVIRFNIVDIIHHHENAIRYRPHPHYRTEAVLDGFQMSN